MLYPFSQSQFSGFSISKKESQNAGDIPETESTWTGRKPPSRKESATADRIKTRGHDLTDGAVPPSGGQHNMREMVQQKRLPAVKIKESCLKRQPEAVQTEMSMPMEQRHRSFVRDRKREILNHSRNTPPSPQQQQVMVDSTSHQKSPRSVYTSSDTISKESFKGKRSTPKMNCSGFADWVFYNASGGSYVIGHGGGAHAQHTYCTPITWNEAQPGDLVFYPDDVHVGIVGGRDDAGNLLVIHCASSANNVVITGKNGFIYAGRPRYYS